jgi:serine phosphatase RsbU (regulator of sigma subunit)
MQRLHEFLRPLLAPSRFASAVIGHLQDRGGTLMLANAGHCPPLIRRSDGRIERVGSTGPVAGVLAASQWTAHITRLEPGESLALYTDGLVESQVGGEDVGVDRVAHAFSRSSGRSARDIAEHLTATAGVVDDDLTVLVVRR